MNDLSDLERLASLIRKDFRDDVENAFASPHFAAQAEDHARRIAKSRPYRGVTDLNFVIHDLIVGTFDATRDAACIGLSRERKSRLERCSVVVIASEDSSINTQRRADGNYLVQITTAFISEVTHLLQLIDASADGLSEADHQNVMTALRFHQLARVAFDESMWVGYRNATEASYQMMAALIFAIGHELAHVALGHLDETDSRYLHQQRALETEADLFAKRALQTLTVFAKISRKRRLAREIGVRALLLTVEMRTLGLWIRRPTSHDAYDDRITRTTLTPLPQPLESLLTSMYWKIRVASDFTVYFPEDAWNRLLSTSTYYTQGRPEHVYTYVRHFDTLLGRTDEANRAVLRQPGVVRADYREALDAVLAPQSTISEIVSRLPAGDRSSQSSLLEGPLSRQDALNFFRSLHWWGEPSAAKDLGAFAMMRLLQEKLHEVE